jgi:FAD/FMN-containing dehydrogenase
VPGAQPSDLNLSHTALVFHCTGNPAVIVRGHTPEDIVSALRFAREQPLDVSVSSGGHSFSGLGSSTGGLVLDLAPFSAVEVCDPAQHLVRIGAGPASIRKISLAWRQPH